MIFLLVLEASHICISEDAGVSESTYAAQRLVKAALITLYRKHERGRKIVQKYIVT